MTMAETAADPALAPVHPGEVLAEDFLQPYGLTAYAAAGRLHVPRTRIERLVRGQSPVTVDTARRLARLFGTTPQFWLNLQSRYDLDRAEVATPDLAAIEPFQTA
jgi:addiction module HigA family antidote